MQIPILFAVQSSLLDNVVDGYPELAGNTDKHNMIAVILSQIAELHDCPGLDSYVKAVLTRRLKHGVKMNQVLVYDHGGTLSLAVKGNRKINTFHGMLGGGGGGGGVIFGSDDIAEGDEEEDDEDDDASVGTFRTAAMT